MGRDRWVLFSTFDPDGLPDPSAHEQVEAYGNAGFKTFVIDTSPELSNQRHQHWESAATKWRQRENVGYDFGSYKYALDCLLKEEKVESDNLDLVLANDSCFGPFVSLKSIFDAFDRAPDEPDVAYGMTDSLQEGHHLQSYWLYFRAASTHHIIRFFENMKPAKNRDEAIAHGELALGAFLRAASCRLVAYSPARQTLAELASSRNRLGSILEFGIRKLFKRWKYGKDVDTQCLRFLLNKPCKLKYFNPVILFGVELYRSRRFPFVKKSMLRDNIYRSPDLPKALSVRGLSNSEVRKILDLA